MTKTLNKIILILKKKFKYIQRIDFTVCLLIACTFLCFNISFAQSKLNYTQQLSISEGLAHNGITSVIEDDKGFLWIGTYDGLNRYDGYELKTFKNTIDVKLFTSNRIRTLMKDSRGNIWIGTDEGVTIYDYKQEQFNNIYPTTEPTGKEIIIRKFLIHPSSDMVIAATEGHGLLLFTKDYVFDSQHFPKYLSTSSILFYDGLGLDDDNYLFSTSAGLLQFNFKTKEFKPVLKENVGACTSITQLNNQSILLTLSKGIGIVDFAKKGQDYTFLLKRKDFLDEAFKQTTIDKLGNLWLGKLREGVLVIKDLDAFVNNQSFATSTFNLPAGLMRISDFGVTTNGFWVGTFNEGLFRFDLKESPFKSVNSKAQTNVGLYADDIVSIVSLDENRVFVTSQPKGLTLFNTETEQFEPITFIPQAMQAEVSNIFIDAFGDIWLNLGTGKGLYRFRKQQKKLEKVEHKKLLPTLHSLSFRSLKEDKNGNVWIGGSNNVCKISFDKDRNIQKMEFLDKHPMFANQNISRVRSLYLDAKHDFIWIGTNLEGLFRIKVGEDKPLKELEIEQFKHELNNFNSISSNFVTSIVCLPNDELWIGTERGGICKVLNRDKAPTFQSFTEKDGLSNNVVKNLIYDDNNGLWITTNIGLNKLNINSLTFQKFNKEDGLPFEDFSYAGVKLDNGKVVLAGFDGIAYFNPNETLDDEPLPKVEFEDLKILNTTIKTGDEIRGRVILKESLAFTDEIKLKHNENLFSITVNSLHFSNPKNHYIKYQLMPINENWIEIPSNQRVISYNGLQPGKYTLRVMASNSLNNWTGVKELKITISPPFWKTPFAYFLYVIFGIMLIALAMFVILRLQKLQHNLQIEKIEKDNVKKINAAKLRFFSNISHEIKTPITLISGPVALLANQFKYNSEVNDKLNLIQRQSDKITKLIDQVHDFQKADANLLQLHYSRFCFNDFIQNIITDFEFMAKSDNKTLIVNGSNSKIYVSADKDKLQIVFNNLLSNAFKFTNTKDEVSINYQVDDKDLLITVKDTGRGIKAEDLPYIFDRFYQSHKEDNSYFGGAGIGLAFSKRLIDMHYGYIAADETVKKGATFHIRLPIVIEKLSKEQLETEKELLSAEQNFSPIPQLREKIDLSNIKINEKIKKSLIYYAEDNPDMRDFVSGILENFFKVKAFPNGQECLKALEDEWPEIIISDVLMPEMNGLELCQQVKSDIKTSHIPIVLLTACTTIDDQIKGMQGGADAYIQKPFNATHLITTTEALLINRQQLRERFQSDFHIALEKTKVNPEDNIFLEKFYDLMAENLDNQDLDLDKFARKLSLNRTHFYQKIKALTNETPYELMKSYRLKSAAELLVNKKLSVKEVFLMTGFKSRTHFSKLFKEKYGVSPGKYGK